MSIEVKIIQLTQEQYRKGTPFENFLWDLSTNEKPAFWALHQSEASILARFFLLIKSGVPQCKCANWLLIVCQLTTNASSYIMRQHPFKVFWVTNWLPIKIQSTTNWITQKSLNGCLFIYNETAPVQSFMRGQLTSNWNPIDYQLNHSENFEQVLVHI